MEFRWTIAGALEVMRQRPLRLGDELQIAAARYLEATGVRLSPEDTMTDEEKDAYRRNYQAVRGRCEPNLRNPFEDDDGDAAAAGARSD